MPEPYYEDESVTLWHGDALDVLRQMSAESVNCIVTSPPYYGLRDYGVDGQYGLEPSPVEYVETMRTVFAEARRVLTKDGTLWLNIGDSYSAEPPGASPYADRNTTLSAKRHTAATRAMRESVRTAAIDRTKFLPRKNLLGIPWRVAFALQDDGWTLRNAVIWHKPNAMPESVTDRLSGRYEVVFLFSRAQRYWFDLDAIRQPATEYAGRSWEQRREMGADGGSNRGLATVANPIDTAFAAHERGRNPGDVWSISTQPLPEAHFAVMARSLAERCIQAGCKPDGVVLDPFSGSGTTGLAAAKFGRRYVGIDLNRDYLDLSLRTRLAQGALMDGEAS